MIISYLSPIVAYCLTVSFCLAFKASTPSNADFRFARNRGANPPLGRSPPPCSAPFHPTHVGSACASHQVPATYDARYSSIIRRLLRPAGRGRVDTASRGRRRRDGLPPRRASLLGVACFHYGQPCVGTPSSLNAALCSAGVH